MKMTKKQQQAFKLARIMQCNVYHDSAWPKWKNLDHKFSRVKGGQAHAPSLIKAFQKAFGKKNVKIYMAKNPYPWTSKNFASDIPALSIRRKTGGNNAS